MKKSLIQEDEIALFFSFNKKKRQYKKTQTFLKDNKKKYLLLYSNTRITKTFLFGIREIIRYLTLNLDFTCNFFDDLDKVGKKMAFDNNPIPTYFMAPLLNCVVLTMPYFFLLHNWKQNVGVFIIRENVEFEGVEFCFTMIRIILMWVYRKEDLFQN